MVEYYRRPTEPSPAESVVLHNLLRNLMAEHLPQTIVLSDPYTIYDPKCDLHRMAKRFKTAARAAVRALAGSSVAIHDKRSIQIELQFQHWTSSKVPAYLWRTTLTYDTATHNRVHTAYFGIENASYRTLGGNHGTTV